MIDVSDRLLASLRESHAVSVAAYLHRPSGGPPIEVPVIAGSLTADADARSRRRADLTVAFSIADPLTSETVHELAFGGHATVERGVLFADGSTERVQLGYFRVDALTWNAAQGRLVLTLSDRMQQVADEPFLAPWVPTGMKPSTAAATAVHQVFGDSIDYHVLTTPASEPALASTAVYDQDRAAAVSDLAASVGAEAFFDSLGAFVIRPREGGTDGDPVWTIDAGERGVLTDADESLDRSEVRNGVAVRAQGEPETPPIYSLAVDDDAASPTLWGGPFGKVALISTLTGVSTQAQADAAASSLLALRLGLARVLRLASVPNPALEPGDLIGVAYADGRTEPQRVNSMTLDLAPTGGLELGTKSHFRPESLEGARHTVFTGDAVWRELEGAELIAA